MDDVVFYFKCGLRENCYVGLIIFFIKYIVVRLILNMFWKKKFCKND